MSEPAAANVLHLPPEVRHECIRCGHSCLEFHEFPGAGEMAESVRARARELPNAPSGAGDPVAPSRFTRGGLTMRIDGGRCCMLTADRLCALHTAYGAEAKPSACRLFPYRFVQTPGGLYAGLSFTCTAVLEGRGPLVAEQREAPPCRWEGASAVPNKPEPRRPRFRGSQNPRRSR
ncbi:MAG: hypothetical protein M1457_11225, partial [bacterium]|nr:hypothetical protein [bacterium]